MAELSVGILIPLFGTTLGALLVFFMKKRMDSTIKKILKGFAAGVMLAASIWSLILPSIDLSGDNPYTCFIPATAGFIVGMVGLMGLDVFLSKKKKNLNLMNFAVIVHNIPEGLSVGVAFAAALKGDTIAMTAAFALSLGIGIQNIPEGSIVSLNMLPYCSKKRSFWIGFLSGVVEPIASVLAVLLIYLIEPVLPYCLSFAAGAMMYVVVDELIPDSNGLVGTSGFCIGFCIMMILDVMLG